MLYTFNDTVWLRSKTITLYMPIVYIEKQNQEVFPTELLQFSIFFLLSTVVYLLINKQL